MLFTTLKSNLLIIIWVVICVLGTCLQVYRICSEYFAYKISTRVELVVKDIMKVPTMSFCVEVTYLVKWKSMTHQERVSWLHFKNGTNITVYDAINETPQTLDKIHETLVKDSKTYYTVLHNSMRMNISRYFEVTVDLKNILNDFWMYFEDPVHEGSKQDMLEINDRETFLEIWQTMNGRIKCLSMQRKEQFINVINNNVLGHPRWPTNIYFQVFHHGMNNSQSIFSMIIMLTPGKKPLTKDIPQLIMSESARMKISWQAFESILLPKPFKTQCLNYSTLGFLSRGDCFEKCMIKSMDKETNGTTLPLGVQVHDGEEIAKSFLSYGQLNSPEIINNQNETWEKLIERIKNTCEMRCQAKDCMSMTYNAISWEKMKRDKPAVGFTIPFTPTISSSAQEAISLIQFLTDVGSALGFWSGISAFGVFDLLQKLVTTLLSAKESTRNRVRNLQGNMSDERRLNFVLRVENSANYIDTLVDSRGFSIRSTHRRGIQR